jgi:hypothetical protein
MKVRASSGVQSISRWIFMGGPPGIGELPHSRHMRRRRQMARAALGSEDAAVREAQSHVCYRI